MLQSMSKGGITQHAACEVPIEHEHEHMWKQRHGRSIHYMRALVCRRGGLSSYTGCRLAPCGAPQHPQEDNQQAYAPPQLHDHGKAFQQKAIEESLSTTADARATTNID